MSNEEEAQAANQLEAFRRIAQAQADRERFLPRGAGVLHGGISAAATIAAQGLTGSASDYMRMALPVRESDNGDAISGSGKFSHYPDFRIFPGFSKSYVSFFLF